MLKKITLLMLIHIFLLTGTAHPEQALRVPMVFRKNNIGTGSKRTEQLTERYSRPISSNQNSASNNDVFSNPSKTIVISEVNPSVKQLIDEKLDIWDIKKDSSRGQLIDAYYDIIRIMLDNGLADYIKEALNEGYNIAFWALPRSGTIWANIWTQVIADRFKDRTWRIDSIIPKGRDTEDLVIESLGRGGKGQIVFVLDSVINRGDTALRAFDALAKTGIAKENIVFCTLAASPKGVELVENADIRRFYTGVIVEPEPQRVFGDVGDRLFGPALKEWIISRFNKGEEVHLRGRAIDVWGKDKGEIDIFATSQLDARSLRVLLAWINDKFYSLRLWTGDSEWKIWRRIGEISENNSELHLAKPVFYLPEQALLVQERIKGPTLQKIFNQFKSHIESNRYAESFGLFRNFIDGFAALINTLEILRNENLSYFSIHPENIIVKEKKRTFYLTSIIHPYRSESLGEQELIRETALLLEMTFKTVLGIGDDALFTSELAEKIENIVGLGGLLKMAQGVIDRGKKGEYSDFETFKTDLDIINEKIKLQPIQKFRQLLKFYRENSKEKLQGIESIRTFDIEASRSCL